MTPKLFQKMATNEYINPQALVAKVKMLINAQLKEILKREGLAVSGLKSVLQERIISRKSQDRWKLGRQIYFITVSLNSFGVACKFPTNTMSLWSDINAYASSGNREGFERMRARVNDPKGAFTPSPGLSRTPQPGSALPPMNPTYNIPNGHPRPPQPSFAPKMAPQAFGPGTDLSWSQ